MLSPSRFINRFYHKEPKTRKTKNPPCMRASPHSSHCESQTQRGQQWVPPPTSTTTILANSIERHHLPDTQIFPAHLCSALILCLQAAEENCSDAVGFPRDLSMLAGAQSPVFSHINLLSDFWRLLLQPPIFVDEVLVFPPLSCQKLQQV